MPPNASAAQSPPPSSVRPRPLPLPLTYSPFRIKQEGKFYDRLLAKDRDPCRYSYYCADRGSVPFLWESRPGTPIDGVSRIAAGVIPAVTLPPSYLIRHCYGKVAPDTPRPKRRAKSKISSIFGSLTRRIRRMRAAPGKSSSSRRWLFSERGDHRGNHGPEPTADERIPPLPGPWMLPLQFSGFGKRSVRRWLGINHSALWRRQGN